MTFGQHAIANGDVLETLRRLPPDSFDGALFDPPYGYGNHQPTVAELVAYMQGAELDTGGDFMGNDWHVPSVTFWLELLRVLKPGAPVMSFGGARTGWLIALGICAAGFELRDELCWLYGKGFPKSLNVSWAIDKAAGHKRKADEPPITALAKQWAGTGTALKPAREPIYFARKALDCKSVSENIAKWGVGGLDIDGGRIPTSSDADRASYEANCSGDRGHEDNRKRELAFGMGCGRANDEGRWPANLCLDEEAGAILDAEVGDRPSSPYPEHTADGTVLPLSKRTAGGYTDDGGPSRFFYSSKVSSKEREHGCELLPMRSAGEVTGGREDESAGLSSPRAGAGRGKGAHNHHPTLKPISLAKWLAALIKPPTDNAKLLIPFSGAGSEMIGSLQAGWPMVLGIEQDPDFVTIAHARIAAWSRGAP